MGFDKWMDEVEQPQVKRRARCRECIYLNWNFITDEIDESPSDNYCGLHGCATVDPDGVQQDLDHRGGCGFFSKHQQLSLFDEL